MKNLLTLLSLFLLLNSARATHNRAGEILYKRIAPFTNTVNGITVQVYTYSITVIKYTDDGLNVANRCIDTVYFGDGSIGLAPRINGASCTNCGSINGTAIACGSLIVNNPTYKVKYNVYSITHTYAGTGTYLITSSDPNRNAGVHNIPNSVNIPFHLESLLIISSSTGSNSSPVLTNAPIDQATIGVCFYHNVGAVDADGDSLSYEITPCRVGNGQTIPGYSYPDAGFNGTFTINPLTGLLTWCSPQFLDEYNIAIIVKEWRKNSSGIPQLIGYVLRDMQVLVKYGVVGVSETTLSKSPFFYPNPATNLVTVNLGTNVSGNEQVTLYSSDGRVVLKLANERKNDTVIVDLKNLPTGVYFLQIQTTSGPVSGKLIKD